MRRRAAWALCAAGLLAVIGCGRGEDVPLTAPGEPTIWPVDGHWAPLPWVFAGLEPRDGAWDPASSLDAPGVVVVGSAGRVVAHGPGGWTDHGTVAAADLARVVCLGPGEFLAVGSAGTVMHRRGGTWRREEAATTADIEFLVTDADTLWAGAPDGTLRRRDRQGWRSLVSPGPLSGLARQNGELVAGRSGRDSLVVWRDGAWRPLAPGPWAGHPVRSVAATGDMLAVAADSIYAHDGTRWSTASFSRIPDGDEVRLRARPDGVRWRTRGPGEAWYQRTWESRTLADGQWGLPVLGSSGSGAIIDLAAGRSLAINRNGRIAWSAPEFPLRYDPAGAWSIYRHAAVPGVGLLLATSAGVLAADEHGVRVLVGTGIYSDIGTSYVIPVGDSFADFYLVGRRSLARCTDGNVTLTPLPPDMSTPRSAAIDGAGRLHIANSAGVWRLAAGAWARVLPVDGSVGTNGDVWPMGDGRLTARLRNEIWLIDGDRRLSLGNLGDDERPLVGPDGIPFLIRRVYVDEWGPAVNSLHVWDDRRGALREVGTRRMGLLVDADVRGLQADRRGPLFWTDSPALVFTLVGSPLEAGWRLLAGPGTDRLEAIVRLADGTLLALDNSERGLHFYRP